MSYFEEFKCPHCSTDIEVEVFRWGGKGKCPSCSRPFEIDYDFTVGEDGEEFDLYYIKPLSEEEYEDDSLSDLSSTRQPS